MVATSGLAEIAALIGDPARANMLTALMDGRPLTASELAYVGRVSAPTASAHLARLRQANLLSVEQRGRCRYYRLATPLIATVIESLMTVAAENDRPRAPRLRGNAALREARTCYDHLAGRLGVAIADAFARRGYAEFDHDGGVLTDAGAAALRALAVRIEEGRRVLCRPCLDWSERRPHLAGRLGAALCRHCFENDWISRVRDTRAVEITPRGAQALQVHFGISVDALRAKGPAER